MSGLGVRPPTRPGAESAQRCQELAVTSCLLAGAGDLLSHFSNRIVDGP